MKKILLISIALVLFVFHGTTQNKENLPIKVFLLAGQSNMDGCGVDNELPAEYKTSPENVRVWDNKEEKWVKLGETSFSIRRDHQFGPEMEFSHSLSKAFPDFEIRLIKTSGGGTKLFNQWIPGGGMYRRFMENIHNALTSLEDSKQKFEVCGMLWMQGESDSETLEMANAYEENLISLFATIRKVMAKDDLPVIMGRISSSLLKETPWVFDQTPIVQKAQESVAKQDPNVFIINTDRLSTLWDNTHFDTEGQLKLGKKMARVMIKQIR